MIPLSIKFLAKGDAPPPELKDAVHIQGQPSAAYILDDGTAAHQPTVGLRIDVTESDGGKIIIVAETTAKLIVTLARVLTARYPNLQE